MVVFNLKSLAEEGASQYLPAAMKRKRPAGRWG